MTDFKDLGLSPALLAPLARLGFDAPTPIQRDAIPHLLAGRDLMGLAQTGTGKTAAFGLPLIQHLLAERTKPAAGTVRALVLSPTRELANQIADNLRSYTHQSQLRIAVVVGGASIRAQMRTLSRGTDILVATPGRLIDLLDRRALRLDETRHLVLDEADQMLDLGFIHALRQIAKLLGTPRQTMLFSATMPKQMAEIARTYLTDPVRVEVSPPGKAADQIRQSVHFVAQSDKTALLKSCLTERPDALSLVFSRTKHGAERLMKQLCAAGFDADSIHGNKSQGQRERAIRAFRTGQTRILVATDVAARGIDIPGVTHVYNFDLPEVAESYVHRIGRTARAGASGEAIAFCVPDETGPLRDIEKLMGIRIDVAGGEPVERAAPPAKGKGPGRRPGKPGHKRTANAGHSAHGHPGAGDKPARRRPSRRRRAPGEQRASA